MKDGIAKTAEKLIIKEENCLTDFIHAKAPKVSINESQLAAIHQINTATSSGLSSSSSTHTNPHLETKNTPGNFVVDLLKQGALSIGGVKNECWKNKDEVNTFYHNLLSQFIFIYLDCGKNSVEQIDNLLQQIHNGKINEAIDFLKLTRERFVQSLAIQKNTPAMVVTNAANPTNLGGAVTYKKGTVEEAICRKSDLFLYMLLYHSNGDYQKNILVSLLNEFKDMLSNNKLPITNKKDSDIIAEKWVNLVYKVSHEGYYIDPANVHINQNVLFTGTQNLPSLSTLTQPGYATGSQFINHFQVATVIDSVSTDKRTETKVLMFTGIKEEEKEYSFDDNLSVIFKSAQSITGNEPCTLAIVPLGCGAFGNKIEDFSTALNHKIKSHQDKNVKPVLVTRADNCLPLLRTFENNHEVKFNFTPATAYELWCNIWNNSNSDPAFSQNQIKDLNLILNYIKNNLNSFDKDFKNQMFNTELKRAGNYTHKNSHKRKVSLAFCYLIADQNFKLIFEALAEALNNYDSHTGYKGTIFNAFSGEHSCLIKLRKIYQNIHEHCSAETSFNLFKELTTIVLEKKRMYPDKSPPSLLDQSFNILEKKLNEIPSVKNHITQTTIEFFKKVPALKTLSHDPSFAVECATNLSLQDIASMNLTCKTPSI